MINRITGNANRTLGFLKRNIKIKLPRMRETAYNSLVRPQLEYAAPVSDPHVTLRNILQIKQIQHQAARWITSDYNTRSKLVLHTVP